MFRGVRVFLRGGWYNFFLSSVLFEGDRYGNMSSVWLREFLGRSVDIGVKWWYFIYFFVIRVYENINLKYFISES